MKPWSGRFTGETARSVEAYTDSTKVDARMILEDAWGSEAHAIMLARQEIISEQDLKKILKALKQLRRDYTAGRFKLDPALEDVHMNVEAYVTAKAGEDAGGKLHTARSRNDQVLTDAKLVVRKRLLTVMDLTLRLQKTLISLARRNSKTVMPGYTHTQAAQPITFAFWASSYASALSRDVSRLEGAYRTTNKSPLGACALAGTSHPIDRKLTARLLGFDGLVEHALDAVSSRDFMAESLSSLAILMNSLSRLAEDIILFSTSEFGFITLSDEYTTGSSIMPQKKNPDVAELLRGRTGRVYGLLFSLLSTLKGLSSGYSRDLQEDKPPLFEAFDVAESSLAVLNGMVDSMKLNKKKMSESAAAGFLCATELADYLVREKGVPFRKSHRMVGQTIKALIKKGQDFSDVAQVEAILKAKKIEVAAKQLEKILNPNKAVYAHSSLGGTSPREVGKIITSLKNDIIRREQRTRKWENKIALAQKMTARAAAGVLAGKPLSKLLH